MVRALAILALLGCAVACDSSPGSGGSTGFVRNPAADSPLEFGPAGEFRLTERSGREVTQEDLLGRPWLAGCIFTRCGTICPALTTQMRWAQERLRDTDARLVSISVDPEHDTPEILGEYAREFAGADPDRWWFLTGEEARIHAWIRDSFHLAVAKDPAAPPAMLVAHSSLLVAVDGEGRIRGYYEGTTREGTARAVARVRHLAGAAAHRATFHPTLNAALNGLSAVLLLCGLLAIRWGRRCLHAGLMRAALVTSIVFLVSYLHYHFVVLPDSGGPVHFVGEGAARAAYLVLLVIHVIGALVNLPMVLRTLWLARAERWEEHKRLARLTFPLWLAVSVTGVAVYFALYGLTPPS
ncbi:MAG: DUF420 domain-containing protein [Planctomycetota bacterium]|nr:DUF420 domain-containing protein [Planctomycetota bacterium]